MYVIQSTHFVVNTKANEKSVTFNVERAKVESMAVAKTIDRILEQEAPTFNLYQTINGNVNHTCICIVLQKASNQYSLALHDLRGAEESKREKNYLPTSGILIGLLHHFATIQFVFHFCITAPTARTRFNENTEHSHICAFGML